MTTLKSAGGATIGEPEVFAEFLVTYLTEVVDMDPRAERQRARGLVEYKVYARNAEDAIRRLREQEPIAHPIVEVAGVRASGGDSTQLILPIEWGAVGLQTAGGKGLIHSN